MSVTPFYADALLAALVGRTPLPPPPAGQLWLALLLDPNGPEIDFPGYARPELAPTLWGEPAGGQLTNAVAIALPRPAAGEAGPVTGFALHEHATDDAPVRAVGVCRPFLLSADDVAPQIPAGVLRLQLA